MQLAEQHYLMERALFYSTFSIQEQLLKGKSEYSFMPVYFIVMMDSSTHPDEPDKFFYKYDLREIYSGEPMTDRVHYYFLELPKGAAKNQPWSLSPSKGDTSHKSFNAVAL